MLIEKLANVKRFGLIGKRFGICSAGKKLQRMKKKKIDRVIKLWYSVHIRFKSHGADHEDISINEGIFTRVCRGALPRYQPALVNIPFFIEAMNDLHRFI